MWPDYVRTRVRSTYQYFAMGIATTSAVAYGLSRNKMLVAKYMPKSWVVSSMPWFERETKLRTSYKWASLKNKCALRTARVAFCIVTDSDRIGLWRSLDEICRVHFMSLLTWSSQEKKFPLKTTKFSSIWKKSPIRC